MTTLSLVELANVSGGQLGRGQSWDQIQDRKRSLCMSPTPAEARRHYDTMVQRMGPGVWPRSIKAIGELCGWPVPDGAKNAKQIG